MPRRSTSDLIGFALSLPEAWEDRPWEEDRVAKVRKKIFVFFGSEQRPTSISVKLPHSAPYALTLGCTEPTSYGLGRSGWVTVHLNRANSPDAELLRDWIVESYRAVAPKTLARLT